MPSLATALSPFRDLLAAPLFTLGKVPVTLSALAYFLFLIALLIYATGRLKRWLLARVLSRTRMDVGAQMAVASIARYLAMLIGLMFVLQTSGIDVSAFTILAGSLGVGIGFGLQTITNNFVSGLIILFERPIKVGDRVEVGGLSGTVTHISARATTILTNDHLSIIVPNSEFITQRVVNWSLGDGDVRFRIPVGVAYGSDPDVVRQALLEVAAAHAGVLETPPPDVQLRDFGESALQFQLRVWTREYVARPGHLRSEINYAIHRKFRERGIEIPYPRRDLRIRDERGGSWVPPPPPVAKPE